MQYHIYQHGIQAADVLTHFTFCCSDFLYGLEDFPPNFLVIFEEFKKKKNEGLKKERKKEKIS